MGVETVSEPLPPVARITEEGPLDRNSKGGMKDIVAEPLVQTTGIDSMTSSVFSAAASTGLGLENC